MDKKQLLMIAAGGAAATILGVFLPWVSWNEGGLGAFVKAAGVSTAGISSGTGKIALLLSLVGGGIAGAVFLGKKLPMAEQAGMLTAMICMGIAALLCVIDFLDIGGPYVSKGIGIWLCVAGSIAAAGASFMLWQKAGGKLPSAAGSGDGGGGSGSGDGGSGGGDDTSADGGES